jgi:basic membrane protein A
MKKLSILALGALLPMIMACSNTSDKAESVVPKIVMVTDVGGVHDQSFNQSAWEGLQKLRDEQGIQVSYYESTNDNDYLPFLENAIDEKATLVWGIGFKIADAVKAAHEAHADQKIGIIDYAYEPTMPNVTGVIFKVQDPAYMAGYISAKMSKTGKLGIIGAFDSPIINTFEYGFMAGAKAARPDVVLYQQYTNSFSDATIGKSIALGMFNQGVDVVFPIAGDSGNGAIEAAKEQNKWAVGVDRDQNYLAPKNVITSVIKRVDMAIYEVSQAAINGEQFGGNNLTLGLTEKAVDIAPTTKENVPADILIEVEKVRKDLIDGKIKVPVSKSEYLAMGYTLSN